MGKPPESQIEQPAAAGTSVALDATVEGPRTEGAIAIFDTMEGTRCGMPKL
jgi:hypothetical protein